MNLVTRTYANLLLVLALCVGWAGSQGTNQRLPAAVAFAAADISPAMPRNDQDEMEQFFDQTIPQQLARHQIPGGTISVVKDGRLRFAKGYGLADVEHQIPVNAQRTLFRIGSTSKLFTWTAVMQLVEQGQLDLDRDVNTYLRNFQIPATYPEPVTLRCLMTHTAGFEEQLESEIAEDAESLVPIADYLARYMPARVRPPGQLTAYSNYGTALAGYIIASVSGMSFEAYVEEHIFRPLGMARSTFRQPLPPSLVEDLATGYSLSSGSFAPEPFHYVSGVPAGAMSSTAVDMAQFMIAHLQDGQYGETTILQETTAQLMHQRQFANDPRLNGFALGFFDLRQNQLHVLEHGGGMPTYHTLMALLPEQDTGIFISYNSAQGISAVGETFQAFLDHYYPVKNALAPEPLAGFANRAARFAGHYRSTRFVYTKVGRVSYLSGLGFGRVSANPDGTLLVAVDIPRGRLKGTFVEVAPLVFRETNGPESLIFKEDPGGNVTHLFIDSMPHFAFEKIAWYETAWFSQRVLFICVATFISVILAFVGGLIRTRRKPDFLRVAAFGASLLALLLVLGYAVVPNATWLTAGVRSALTMLLPGLSLSMPFLAGLLVVLAVLAWLRGYWALAARIHYTLSALAVVAFAWFLGAWNLLGFHL